MKLKKAKRDVHAVQTPCHQQLWSKASPLVLSRGVRGDGGGGCPRARTEADYRHGRVNSHCDTRGAIVTEAWMHSLVNGSTSQ